MTFDRKHQVSSVPDFAEEEKLVRYQNTMENCEAFCIHHETKTERYEKGKQTVI